MLKHVLALSLILVSGYAAAQSEPAGFYVEGGAGRSHINEACDAPLSCSLSDTGYKLVFGYQYGNGWAGELAYVDYGKATGHLGPAWANLKVHGVEVGGAYSVPFGTDWSGALRLGLANNHVSLDSSSGATASKSHTSAYVGLSVGYHLNQHMSLNLGFDDSQANDTTGNLSVTLWYLSAKYLF